MDTVSQALLRELQDRQDIEELVSRYAHGLDRHDEALIAGVYHADAKDWHGPFAGSIPEFVPWVNALHEQKTRAHTHNITTHWCELQGDRAFADSYVIFVLYRREREVVMMGSGRYIDRLERRSGVWKIAERRTIIDIRLEADAQALGTDYPRGTWDRTDIAYLRPLATPSEIVRARIESPAIFQSQATRNSGSASELLASCAARRAIKDCIVQSVRGLDRADRELTLDQYVPGAKIDGDSVENQIDELLARFDGEDIALTHNLTSHFVEMRENVATAETSLIRMRQHKDGATGSVGGLRLLDRLENRAGHWRIASRQVVADSEFTGDGSAINTDAQYLRSRRDRADISYERH
jgi:hypothetical protein